MASEGASPEEVLRRLAEMGVDASEARQVVITVFEVRALAKETEVTVMPSTVGSWEITVTHRGTQIGVHRTVGDDQALGDVVVDMRRELRKLLQAGPGPGALRVTQ